MISLNLASGGWGQEACGRPSARGSVPAGM